MDAKNQSQVVHHKNLVYDCKMNVVLRLATLEELQLVSNSLICYLVCMKSFSFVFWARQKLH